MLGSANYLSMGNLQNTLCFSIGCMARSLRIGRGSRPLLVLLLRKRPLLTRGLFLKYEAILKAEMAAKGLVLDVQICLATGRELTNNLARLKRTISVESIYIPSPAEPRNT